ncbi:Gag-polypeptide of LTR copia-type [Sesbania bispinosa]|nr:Gag-polypeptide of LTR copia-type [Sesbania bispinosa]
MEESSKRFVPQTFSNPVSEKLDETNFLIWKFQVVSTIKGYKLQSFINGNGGMPRKYLSEEDEEQQNLNPEFVNWEQQDQPLTSWLLSSMTKRLTTRVIDANMLIRYLFDAKHAGQSSSNTIQQ